MSRRKFYLCNVVLILYFAAQIYTQTIIPDPDPLRFESDINTFIDWDQNNTFDTDELVLNSDPTSTTWNHDGTVSVPYDAAIGTTRMRVVCDYHTHNNLTACQTNWGENFYYRRI